MMRLNVGIYGYATRHWRRAAHLDRHLRISHYGLTAKGGVYRFTSGEYTYHFIVDSAL